MLIDTSTVLAISSTPLLLKLLGPTSEYIGEGLKNITEKRILIEDNFAMGSNNELPDYFHSDMKPGIIFEPSALGIELYLWAHGRSDLEIKSFNKKKNAFLTENTILIPSDGYAHICK